jgi:hypothetical protein
VNVHAQRRPAIAPISLAPRSDLEASFGCDSGKMLWPVTDSVTAA